MSEFDEYLNHIIDTEFYAQAREEFVRRRLLLLKRKIMNILDRNPTIGDRRKLKKTLDQLDEITDEDISELEEELEEERNEQLKREDGYLREFLGATLLASTFLSLHDAKRILNSRFNSKDNFSSFKKNLKSDFKKAYTGPLNSENHFGGNTSHAEDTISRNIDRIVSHAASDVHTMTTALQRDAYRNVVRGSGFRLQYVAMLDSSTCPVCGVNHGMVFDEDEAPDVPLHNNCRCVLVHVRGDGYTLRDYNEWLRRQPDDVQEKILGKTRYAMYRSGYISNVGQFTSKGRLLTLDELYARKVPRKNGSQLVYYNPKMNTSVIYNSLKQKSEFKENFEAAKIIADYGYNVTIEGKFYKERSADLFINNIPYEVKTNYIPTKSAIDNAIRSAGHKEGQSSNIILRITSDIDISEIKPVVKRRFIRKEYFKNIILIDKNNKIYGFFDRNDVLEW